MSIPTHPLGQQFDISRTFTAVASVDAIADVDSTTCVMLDPIGTEHDVTLTVVVDNLAVPPTATFTGTFRCPRASYAAGAWLERWDTGPDLVDGRDYPWWGIGSAVVAAEEAASV